MPELRVLRISSKPRRRPDKSPNVTDTRQMPKAIMGTRLRLNADGNSEPVADRRMAWGISVSNAIITT